MMKRIIALLVLIIPFFGFSQNRTVSTQNHLWLVYTGTFQLYQKLHLYTEYQWRRDDLGKNWQQSLPRMGFELKFNPTVQATAGYAFVTTYPYGEQPVPYQFNEQRLWEQVNVVQEISKLKIQHRYRLEQRWLEQKTFNSTANDYVFNHYMYLNRARYRVMLTYPLLQFKNESKLLAALADELFIGFGRNVKMNVFDQNRFYAGINYSLNSHLTFSLGYLDQYIVKSSGTLAENDYTIQVGLTLTY